MRVKERTEEKKEDLYTKVLFISRSSKKQLIQLLQSILRWFKQL